MKHALRQHLKEKRRGLPAGLYAEKSKKIIETLSHLPEYVKAKHILFYVSTPEEVDTHVAIQKALSEGKKIHLPRIIDEKLVLCPLEDFNELKPGHFGILEPSQNQNTDPLQIDLMVIPGVGFDHRGQRLGHGKGHYDRLLKETRGYKVGLAFEEQLVPELPIEAHDVPVDALITDQNLLYFQH